MTTTASTSGQPQPIGELATGTCSPASRSRSASTMISTSFSNEILRFPAELLPGLGGVSDEMVDLRRAHERRIGLDVVARLEAGVRESEVGEFLHGVLLPCRDHVVVGLLLLEHQPHRLDVVACEAPVSLGVEVAEAEFAGEAELDPRDAVRDLARHELEPAARRLVVEEDPRDREEAVRLAVVDRDEVPVGLRHPVRRARVEGRRLALRNLAHLAEHLGRGRLVEADVRVHAADRLQKARDADSGELSGQHRLTPGGGDEALRAEVVDLFRP